jgi:hypothetical protein
VLSQLRCHSAVVIALLFASSARAFPFGLGYSQLPGSRHVPSHQAKDLLLRTSRSEKLVMGRELLSFSLATKGNIALSQIGCHHPTIIIALSVTSQCGGHQQVQKEVRAWTTMDLFSPAFITCRPNQRSLPTTSCSYLAMSIKA